MKVIKLNEAKSPYETLVAIINAQRLDVDDTLRELGINSEADVDRKDIPALQKKVSDIKQGEAKADADYKQKLSQTNQQIDKIEAEFEGNNLKQAVTNLKNYLSGNGFNGVANELNKINDDKFIKYFVNSLGAENLADRHDSVLTTLNTAGNLGVESPINGDKFRFIDLYNIGNGDYGKVKDNYLTDKKAIIFKPILYTLRNKKDIAKIIRANNNGTPTNELIKVIRDGDYSKVGNNEPSDLEKAKDAYDGLSKSDKEALLKQINNENTNK